jgi:hypothetical protein
MWGLVRVEAADRRAAERPEELTARADLISRWVLAEAAPLALPDGRWDKMVYGIRDCEEFLRAVCERGCSGSRIALASSAATARPIVPETPAHRGEHAANLVRDAPRLRRVARLDVPTARRRSGASRAR